MRGVLMVVMTCAACYRESAPPVVASTAPGAAPMTMAAPQQCTTDDLAAPVLDGNPGGRLRTHRNGPLTTAGTWIGAALPAHVPTSLGTLELLLADRADGGTLALYREPYNRQSCTLSGARNCAYVARFYTRDGALGWELALDGL